MRLTLGIGCLATLMFLGCTSGTTEKRYEVTGMVTLDDKPLEEGTISYATQDGGVPGNTTITNGSYKLDTRPGLNKVSINAYKIDPKIKPSNDPVKPVDNRVNMIPKRYNSATELSADVGTEMKFDFKLSSKK